MAVGYASIASVPNHNRNSSVDRCGSGRAGRREPKEGSRAETFIFWLNVGRATRTGSCDTELRVLPHVFLQPAERR